MKKNTLLNLLFFFVLLFSCSKNSSNTTITNAGKSGSLARMLVIGNYLYVIDSKTLTTFDVSNSSNPIETNVQDVGFGIETLFPFANYLFIGSNDGLYIYDLSNPSMPVQASNERFEHVTACDPVVANDKYAYVTLNSLRNECGAQIYVNELQIVDIQNIKQPTLVNKINMKGPKGLGLDNDILFVCDRNLGVIVFDLQNNPAYPSPIDTLSGFTANDVITNNGNLMVVGEDGLRQFNYTDANNITLTSFLDLND